MTATVNSIIIPSPQGKQTKKTTKTTKQEAMKIPNTINELVKHDIVTRIAERAEKLLPLVDSCHHKGKVLFLNPEFATACYPGLCLHLKPEAGDIIIRYGWAHVESVREYHIRTIINALTHPHTVRTIGWVDGERRYWFGRSVWTHTDGQAIVDTDGGIWLFGGNAGSGSICHQHIVGGGLRADFYSVAGNRTMPKNAPAWLSHWDGKRVKSYMGNLYIKTATEVFKSNAINNIWRAVKKSGVKVRLATVKTAFYHAMRGVAPVLSERWRSCGHVGTINCPTITPKQIDTVAAMLSTPTGLAYLRAVERGDKFHFAANR